MAPVAGCNKAGALTTVGQIHVFVSMGQVMIILTKSSYCLHNTNHIY